MSWIEESQRPFENVIALLVSTPVLSGPNFTSPFKLAVAASDCGAGAVLLTEDAQGVDRVCKLFLSPVVVQTFSTIVCVSCNEPFFFTGL